MPVHVVPGFWEDVIDSLGQFDGILFDTYPVSHAELFYKCYLPFIPKAAEHLRPGGVFTFYSGYEKSLPAAHMELLAANFSETRIEILGGLTPPPDCQYFQASEMVVPVCIK